MHLEYSCLIGQEEVEMEDVIVEEPILDIDVSDAKNSLAAVEYVKDLYSFYRKMEVKLVCFATVL